MSERDIVLWETLARIRCGQPADPSILAVNHPLIAFVFDELNASDSGEAADEASRGESSEDSGEQL